MSNLHAFITTPQRDSLALREQAKKIANLLQIPFIERNNRSMQRLWDDTGMTNCLVIGKEGPSIVSKNAINHSFHLSMAELRIRSLERGETDHLIKALGEELLHTDKKVILDCTCGLGADSIVLGYGGGSFSKHIALEGQPLLAYVTNWGMRHFIHSNEKVTNVLRNIQVVNTNYVEYLQRSTEIFDVIYFDPMFSEPVFESPQFLGIRHLVLESSLQEEVLELAKNMALRVIVKDRSNSLFFKKYIPDEEHGGTYSKVRYGVYYGRGQR